MSGIAIIIKGADFSKNNLGKVNFLENIPVESINILGEAVLSGKTAQYTISALPKGTSQTEVIWSITSGNEYAEIDGNGKLTVTQTIESAKVTIKAVSLYNSSVYAEKVITLSSIEVPPINPTYVYGYYDGTKFNKYPDTTESKKYASFDGLTNDIIERTTNIQCEDGWQVRLIALTDIGAITRGENVTSIIDLLSEIKKLNPSAVSFSLNVSRTETTGPTYGTDITDDELQNMNDYVQFVWG